MRLRRVLVLGASGMLGHKMLQVLTPLFSEVWGTVRRAPGELPWLRDLFSSDRIVSGLDVTAFDRLDAVLHELKPDVVINCVGVVKQRAEAHDAVVSITTNSLLPHRLAASLEPLGARLIHFSTDCVFDGRKGMYVEADLCDARDMYGRSKALGEVIAPNALTFRTSIIGRELRGGSSLLEWFLAQQGPVRGFRNAWWSGVTTNHLAEIIAGLLVAQPQLSGLYHLSSGRISKYDLLVRLRVAYGLDTAIEPDGEFNCDRSLDGRLFESATGYHFPGWDAVLNQLVADPTPYKEWVAA